MEQSSYSTVGFVKRAIHYFGCKPLTIQTDNGTEFTPTKKTNRIPSFGIFFQELGIENKLIRPRTPCHNGKVERSHRNDQERFYTPLQDVDFSYSTGCRQKMGNGILAGYTASLLSLAIGHHTIAGMPLAFGEGGTKGRILNLANWKKG